MRGFLLLGTAIATLALGTTSAYPMGNCGKPTPEASPYALLEPQSIARPPSPLNRDVAEAAQRQQHKQ